MSEDLSRFKKITQVFNNGRDPETGRVNTCFFISIRDYLNQFLLLENLWIWLNYHQNIIINL